MAVPANPDTIELCDELIRVRRRRFLEAKQAGLSLVEAQLFADSDTDVGLLRSLVGAGCPVRTLARILI